LFSEYKDFVFLAHILVLVIVVQLATSSAPHEMESGAVRKNSTLICVPVMADSVEEMVIQLDKAKSSGADLVEIRVDGLKNLSPHEDLKTLIKASALPTLFTYRFAISSLLNGLVMKILYSLHFV